MQQTGFVSGGEVNLRRGLEDRIRQEVLAEYAEALSHAGPLRRLWLRWRISREICHRLDREFSRYDSRYNLYGSSRRAAGDRAKKTSDEPPQQPNDPV
jgi:hypothetical protein